jgi:hypothetical protein
MTSFVKLPVAIHSRKQVDLYASLLIYGTRQNSVEQRGRKKNIYI